MIALFIPACSPASEVDETDTALTSAINGIAPHDALALSCSGCHGAGGGAIISLDGLSEAQIATSLLRYKAEGEGTTVMHRLVRGYTEQDIRDISRTLGAEVEEDDA